MPIKIDCPECNGPYGPKQISGVGYCGNCDLGKMKVYTQEELDKAVKQAYENSALICENLLEDENVMTGFNYQCAEAIRARDKQ